ncbi:helix-turn-helix domain-containing protein [Arthrobacter sp. 31Cvi3.1E]|uniref:helix-turn-helix domain-containing protein n=1 Tax=Paenarthrobacter nicotinovorans TaxID=29320 RepID=UPI0009A84751
MAGQLNLHHSSVQHRAAEFSTALGFDIRTPQGRVRLTLALALFLLATNNFD